MFGLVDCNNFYASCERAFNPALEGKPVVVLSNNDGCIIARSNEAKKLGIPMGAPLYKYLDMCKTNGVKIFSANFTLYGDLSTRVMSSILTFVPELEVYSIDEAFMNLDGLKNIDLYKHAVHMRSQIKKWTGIPVSIGIAPTKTLAKVANFMAKKYTESGVFCLTEKSVQDKVLANFPIEEIWGIGRNLAPKLRLLGIETAKDLRDHDLKKIRKCFTVVIERMVLEQRGESCIELETIVPPKKNIISSRSFGKLVTDIADIKEAIANYASRACVKMRSQNSQAQAIYVYLKTNKFKLNERQYQRGLTLGFEMPTNDTRLVINVANKLIDKIFKTGFKYHKAGIMLMNLTPDSQHQYDLFTEQNMEKAKKLMSVMDEVNTDHGRNSIFFAAQGIKRPWQMKCSLRSPRYTTNWNELLQVA